VWREALAVLQQRAMLAFLTKLLLLVHSRLRSQARLEAENLVLCLLKIPKVAKSLAISLVPTEN